MLLHSLSADDSDRATSQWFANLDDIKENALAALEAVTFFPPACTW